ncbi:uncharacterized protein LOC135825878 isoform X2 [Sycon ciliatum]|uniref:uncharacterized protein LOC135825878 isoform X2 n=1 Tax=Sycon ciliatum TaxID=27933 RepID=UPI0031F63CE3
MATSQSQPWLYIVILIYLNCWCARASAAQQDVKWDACPLTSARTWQVDWTFRLGFQTWTEAKAECQSYGGSLATVHTMAQVTCANLTVKGTNAVWVGLTGTWTAGDWSAWKWEVASSTHTTRLPWSSQYILPFKNSNYTHGYLDPNKGLVNWINNFQVRCLCQRYVPKDNWYVCSQSQEASGSLETLYIPTPKTYNDASAECARRGSILANIQTRYHGECARDLLGPRNGQCNSSSSDNCTTSSYFCKTNTCNVWVALQRTSGSKTWTWTLPVPLAANNVSWITAPLQGGGGQNECGYYSPEKETFGFESCSMKLSSYCQRYTPHAPSGVAVNSTDTGIYARILQPQILRDWVPEFCFVYDKNDTVAKPTVVCNNNESIVLSGLETNTMYRVRAFFKTTIGHNSSMSPVVSIGTVPKGRTEGNNLPILQYCVYGRPANDMSGNMTTIPVCNASENVTLIGLAPGMTYNVTTYVSNAYGDSAQSTSTRITTLHQAPTTDQVDATSGYQASASGSKSAAIIAGGSGAGLLVLAVTVFLLWKLKLTPAKPDPVLTTCQLDVRTQSVPHDDELDLVQNTCTSMETNEAYESWILARNDAYGCVNLRENDVLRAGCGAGRAEEGGPATEEEHTYLSIQ